MGVNIRQRSLPMGWYPSEKQEVIRTLASWHENRPPEKEDGIAGIVPHAGWYFSGKLAFYVFSRIAKDIDTIVIVGGHLRPSDKTLIAYDDAFETPLGNIEADKDLAAKITAHINCNEDLYADNTVEIHLPIVKYLFPKVKIVWLRGAPSSESKQLGEVIGGAAKSFGRKIAVIGSTDLTHYGPNYGFITHGLGDAAQEWVKNENDKSIVDAFLKMDIESSIEYAINNQSACSVGGAVAAISFAGELGKKEGHLIDYYTSAEIHHDSSFVGYVGVVY